jgi:hypothetical protein
LTENRKTACNSTYTQAGGWCFVGQGSSIFEVRFFVESSVVKNPCLRVDADRYGTFKMKTILKIIICIFLFGCVDNKGERKEEQSIEIKQVSTDTLTKVDTDYNYNTPQNSDQRLG